jgi:hypothetical protein
MAISYGELQALKQELWDDYHKRHTALRNLRRYWHGDFWKLADSESHPIATIFRDWTSRTSDVGPDIKLVKNVVQEICVKYQTYLSQLPQIRVFVDPPESDNRRAQATLKERYLYGLWSMGDMNQIVNNMGWFLPLMGDVYQACWPNPELGRPTPILRSPEYAWPIMSFDGNEENAVMFIWRVKESSAMRAYPNYVPPDERFPGLKKLGRLRKRPNDDVADAAGTVEIIEYSDANCWVRYVGDQMVGGVEHNFGYNLFEHVKFIDVPGEAFGHGAVEQIINLNELDNALISLGFQQAVENSFPMLVLEDASKAPEDIPTGAGAILPLNPGGKAYYLEPPQQGVAMIQQFTARTEHDIKELAGMSPAEFGQSPASSIVTGKAVNALQQAGAGSRVEMVQGTGIGPALVAWNEKAIRQAQDTFRDTKMQLYGRESANTMEMQGRQFALSIKGSQVVGSTRNEVVFQVALNQHEKLVMGLQALGAKIVSKKWVREQIGVVDNTHMIEEILVEDVDDAVLAFMQAALQGAADPATAAKVEGQANSFLQGNTATSRGEGGAQQAIAGGQPHPLLGMPTGSPGQLMSHAAAAAGPPAVGANPTPGGPALPGLPGGPAGPAGFPQTPPTYPSAGQQAQAGAGTVTTEEVAAAIGRLKGIQGQVFIVGQLADQGKTNGDIDLAITNPSDRSVIEAGLPQYRGKLSFKVVQGEPVEPHVDVTPGRQAKPGGDAGQLAQLVGGGS